jgi:hypothetical protein
LYRCQYGSADIFGDASLGLYDTAETHDTEETEFWRMWLLIWGRSASQAKAEAMVWPSVFDEVADNDNVIGIVLTAERAQIWVTLTHLTNS